MTILTTLATRVLLAATVMGAAAASQAQAQVSFKDKRVTIVIGYGVGGTYHQYAQLFSRHLSRFLPDNPTIIVQTMPGAGGLNMLNHAASQMPSDGSTMFVPPDTMVLLQLTATAGIKFDARKFGYIGTGDQQNNIWIVRKAAASSLDDLRKKEVVMGHSGPGSTGFMIPAVARELLGLKVKLVSGYKGSRDTIIAIERGEIDGAVFGWETWITAVPQWFEKGKEFAVPLLQVGLAPDPDVPTLPMLGNLVKKPDRPVVDLFGVIGLTGRSLALPPGVPDAYLQVYRTAFQKMMRDPEYAAEAKRTRLRVIPVSGDELTKAIHGAINTTDAAVIARTRALTSAK
jgi:tripartite-type tricarboxylate transporter receptor subunit TctC